MTETFGYPSIVKSAQNLQQVIFTNKAALLSLFTMKYGSVIVAEHIGYAEALPLFGLRQNLFTDPQKPMKVEPGVYPLNGADGKLCMPDNRRLRTDLLPGFRRAGTFRCTGKPDYQ